VYRGTWELSSADLGFIRDFFVGGPPRPPGVGGEE